MAEDETIDGAEIAARILASMEPARKQRLVHAISHRAPEIASKIEEKLFDSRSLGSLSPQAAAALTRSVNYQDLALTLSESDEKTREHVLSHMSEHRRQLVLEALEFRANSKPDDLRDAKKRIQEALDSVQEQEANTQTRRSSRYILA